MKLSKEQTVRIVDADENVINREIEVMADEQWRVANIYPFTYRNGENQSFFVLLFERDVEK